MRRIAGEAEPPLDTSCTQKARDQRCMSLSSIVPTVVDLDPLAARWRFLSALVATTYLAELARLYDVAQPHAKLLSSAVVFHVCPACIAEERLLSRLLTLPHITHCPQHQLSLVNICRCGAPLRLFHRQARPFTCPKCALDWNELPRRAVDPERIAVEQPSLLLRLFLHQRDASNCWRAPFDSFTTAWWSKEKFVFLFPKRRYPSWQRADPIREPPPLVI